MIVKLPGVMESLLASTFRVMPMRKNPDFVRHSRQRKPKGKLVTAVAITRVTQHWASAEWDYISLYAQWLLAAQSAALYQDMQQDQDNNLAIHDKALLATRLAEAEHTEHLLGRRVRAAQVRLRANGKTVPDYYAYKRGDHV